MSARPLYHSFIHWLLRDRVLSAAVLITLLAWCYWGLFASDRYVSEAHIIIQGTELGGSQLPDMASLLAGSGGSRDQLLLRDHLLSVDMLQTLDGALDLRGHYSDSDHDLLSRMGDRDAPLEWFHGYYLSRVSVVMDSESGVLQVRAEAYEPQMAQAIVEHMVSEGERHMNAIAHRLAAEQVGFLEGQADELAERRIAARRVLLAYQNEHALISPENTVENIAAIINGLEGRLSDLQANRAALLGYLRPEHASVAELEMQITAIEKQIAQEKQRVASDDGSALNATLEQYQRLQMEAEFAEQAYNTALLALERGRVEATRTLKQVSVLQSPTLPQYPMEPRRLYNSVVFALITLLIAGIVKLMAAIIRDHKD